MEAGVLENVRVLDLSRAIAGPYCGMLLGDLGADVIKVEPPGGDIARHAGISRVGEHATYFIAVNRNKRSIVIDLKAPRGPEVLADLIRSADVLIENFRAGVLERLGFDDARLKTLNPKLIVCSISGYGQTSPYRHRKALDLIGQTMGGMASVTGPIDGPPTPVGASVADILTGLNATIGILAGLLSRGTASNGGYGAVDVSLLTSTLSAMCIEATSYLNTGKTPGRHGGAWFEMFPYDVFPTSDGYIAIGMGADFGRLCRLLGLNALSERTDLEDMAIRLEHRAELKAAMSVVLRQRTRQEWIDLLQAEDILSGPVYALDEALADPAAQHAGIPITLEHEAIGRVRTVDSAFSFALDHNGTSAWQKPRRPPPLLGEHTLEVLGNLGYDAQTIEQLCQSGEVRFLPSLSS
jgi:crotonobetainyl-CoA:carnitine CoA-transferase CaiB-like acyl-CoA transferase